MDFYNKLSGTYDRMTRFDERMPKESEMLLNWQQRFGFHSAIDLACGTGLHAIVLAKMGVETTGIDLSKEMLQQAKKNAARHSATVRWVQASMLDFHQKIQDKVDVLFCLGNSIPHLLTMEELLQTMQNISSVLRPGGFVVLQLLNYKKILKQKKRIVGIHRKDGFEFVRFYDFLENKIRFNILTIEEKNNRLSHSLQSTILVPYTRSELKNALIGNDFSGIQYYGDMTFSRFEPESSANLVVVTEKNR